MYDSGYGSFHVTRGLQEEKKKKKNPLPVAAVPFKRSKPKHKAIEGRKVIKGHVVREGGSNKGVQRAAGRRAIGGSKGTVARRGAGTVARRGSSDVALRRGLSAVKKGGKGWGPYGWILAGSAAAAEEGLRLQDRKNKQGEYITGKQGGSYTGVSPQWKKRPSKGSSGWKGKRDYGYYARPVTERKDSGGRSRVSREGNKTYRGKYFGPDEFRGDEDIRRAYLQAGGKNKFKTKASRRVFANDYRRADAKAKQR